jgi:hypothetical protein
MNFQQIAEFTLGEGDVPEDSLQMAATLLIDTLGVAAGAAQMAPGRIARDHAARFLAAGSADDAATQRVCRSYFRRRHWRKCHDRRLGKYVGSAASQHQHAKRHQLCRWCWRDQPPTRERLTAHGDLSHGRHFDRPSPNPQAVSQGDSRGEIAIRKGTLTWQMLREANT